MILQQVLNTIFHIFTILILRYRNFKGAYSNVHGTDAMSGVINIKQKIKMDLILHQVIILM